MDGYATKEISKLAACGTDRRMTLRERLQENKQQLTARLTEVQEALDMLDKHPDFEKFHNVVGKVGY